MLTVVVGSKEESVISSLSLVSLGSNAVILRIPSLEMKSVFVVFLFVVLLFDNSLVKLEIPLVFLCTGIYRYSLFFLIYRWYSCVEIPLVFLCTGI